MDRRALMGGIAASAAVAALPARAAVPASLPDALSGAFVPWAGQDGRAAGMAQWEAWLGRPPMSVPAMEFWGKDDWDAFAATTWLPAFWARAAPRRPIVWSIPLTVPGTPLSAVAAGRHDDDFAAAARAIAASQPAALIRLGWEMNVSTMAWFGGRDPAGFISAFRRVAALLRDASPGFSIDWCPAWGTEDGPVDLCYPGDDAVDIIGLDVYDIRSGPESVERRWTDRVLTPPFGLDWLARFAREHGKPMSIPEWGVGEAGDDPAFVDAMRAWLATHASEIRYACYFDVDGLWPTRLTGGQFPRSRDAFRRDFGI